VTITVTPVTVYAVNRLTVDVPASVAEFQQQYEQAVPAMPRERVDALVARSAPWEEMLDLIQNEAPFGFLIYWRNDAHPVMRLAGDAAKGIFYLMGNHTIAERMYRYHPAVMLYAPLHTMIWPGPSRRNPLHLRPAQRPVRQFRHTSDHRSRRRTQPETGSPAQPPRPARPRPTKPRFSEDSPGPLQRL
jgi:hypothetical protein